MMNLFLTFFRIGLFSIGGGYAIIPLIQEQVVQLNGWVSQKTFTDIITISQMTPGPLAVNTSTFVGLQILGIPGAITATVGCTIAGILIAIGLYRFFQKNDESIYFTELLKGLKSASIGLIASAAGIILLLTVTGTSELKVPDRVDFAAVAIFAGVLGLLLFRKKKINPILLMVFAGIAGAVIY